MAYKLNRKGRVTVTILLGVLVALTYIFFGKGTAPKSLFKEDTVYHCIFAKSVETFASTNNSDTYVAYGVYCPDVSDEVFSLNLWRGGNVFNTIGDKQLPMVVELEGKNFEFVKKGEWEYKE